MNINVNIKRKLQAVGWGVLTLLTFLFAYLLIDAVLKAPGDLAAFYQGRITGTITGNLVYDSIEGDTVTIEYTFSYGGRSFYGDYDYMYSSSAPHGPNAGDKIEIAYNQANPALNRPASEVPPGGKMDAYVWALIALMLLVFGGLAYFFGFKVWRAWKLGKWRVS